MAERGDFALAGYRVTPRPHVVAQLGGVAANGVVRHDELVPAHRCAAVVRRCGAERDAVALQHVARLAVNLNNRGVGVAVVRLLRGDNQPHHPQPAGGDEALQNVAREREIVVRVGGGGAACRRWLRHAVRPLQRVAHRNLPAARLRAAVGGGDGNRGKRIPGDQVAQPAGGNPARNAVAPVVLLGRLERGRGDGDRAPVYHQRRPHHHLAVALTGFFGQVAQQVGAAGVLYPHLSPILCARSAGRRGNPVRAPVREHQPPNGIAGGNGDGC